MGFNLSIPSPGDFVSGAGRAMQGVENFVSGALTGAISAVDSHAENAAAPATVSNPANPGATQLLDGVVSDQEFENYQRKVSEAFHAVAADIASLRAYGTDGSNGLYSSEQGGGGGGQNNMLLMLLLLGGTTTLTSNPLLLLLMMGGNGFGGSGGGFDIATALALGLV